MRQNVDAELEDFKTRINLSEYAATEGYCLDRKASSRNSAVMRHANGDKIVIARGQDRHWIYFSVRDPGDNGSIIDFVQNRKGMRLGGVRQALRSWSSTIGPVSRPHPDLFARQIAPISKNRAQVLLALARMKTMASHRWLQEERKLPHAVLRSPRFAGTIKVDFRSNAIFAHADLQGPSGYEIKNRGFTGFATGGEKGLWFSAARAGDRTLLIAESALDALSYAALHPDNNTRYASTGGALNPNQPALIGAAIERMGQGACIIIATDNDAAGRALADQIAAIARETGRADLRLVQDLPEGEGADWNDKLRAFASPPDPPPTSVAAP